MELHRLQITEGIAEVTLARGKVNALNERGIEELAACFRELAADPTVSATVLTGQGRFFSFGFDVPELLAYSKDEFVRYLTAFTGLYRDLFLFPRPLVAALNGHTVAGGCMLALACDLRLLVTGGAKISLNEITFGASVFAGSVEMLRLAAGERSARQVLYDGTMFEADEALRLGLVDAVVAPEQLAAEARTRAVRLRDREAAAFASLKRLLRRPAAEVMAAREAESIREFADIWYSPGTWAKLQEIRIR